MFVDNPKAADRGPVKHEPDLTNKPNAQVCALDFSLIFYLLLRLTGQKADRGHCLIGSIQRRQGILLSVHGRRFSVVLCWSFCDSVCTGKSTPSFCCCIFALDAILSCGYCVVSTMQISKVDPDWIAVRLSYGMNGVLMQGKDMLAFASYLEKHSARRPPDHLVVEWFAGETNERSVLLFCCVFLIPVPFLWLRSGSYKHGRKHFAYRYNIFEHFGSSSTLRPADMSGFSKCYEQLVSPIVFEVEQFQLHSCAHDDVRCVCFFDAASVYSRTLLLQPLRA